MLARLSTYLSFVKFSHTVFALPFALVGVSLGFAHARAFAPLTLLYVLLCMVFARSAAMGFNRWADRTIDARNARTAGRELPAGKIHPRHALAFVLINSGLFILCAFLINPLCGWLSPVALAVVLGYSYTKRFTPLCHLILGLGLALAPVGAYIAVTQHFSWPIIVLGMAVLSWVSGFDVVYALQDASFDREQRLRSIPAWLGPARAIAVSIVLHMFTAGLLVYYALLISAGALLWLAVAGFVGLLVYQHTLVKPTDLSRINLAFFTTNGIGSLLFGLLAITDLLQRGALQL